MMDKLYVLKTTVRQKSGGEIHLLEKSFFPARGERGCQALAARLDAFVGDIIARYGETASENAPLIALAYLCELRPQKDGTLVSVGGDYIAERHVRVPDFPREDQKSNI